ncbi:unnamed protein product [Pleuronectes platessa]|uniref:Uncharacterized protein n=1 Tax=Pleuronectes platessa TaxID=8262 RepID=A0A9N7V8D0_PLEPL|nr:unnamed protein product [Pleuronectes platessa]
MVSKIQTPQDAVCCCQPASQPASPQMPLTRPPSRPSTPQHSGRDANTTPTTSTVHSSDPPPLLLLPRVPQPPQVLVESALKHWSRVKRYVAQDGSG